MLSTKKIFFAFLIILVAGAFITLNYSDLLTKEEINQKWFTGEEDHSITLEEASYLTANYQEQASLDQVTAEYFGKEALIAILQQKGAVGLRIYYGMDDYGTSKLVLVGVNSNGDDMTDGLLAERGNICPPLCSKQNELNTPGFSIALSTN